MPFSFLNMKKFAFILAMLPIVSSLAIAPAQAEEQCTGQNCEIRLDYTGSYQSWNIPMGARDISIQLMGAQGGKTGGRGGELNATLPEGISGQLYIFVGGAGSSGSLVPGGFNGGGQAGSAHGDEGSGGGATDIRTSLSVQDRILVAGGGGGTGGWSGGQGGNGGGLIGQDGTAGQGGGGRGGSQVSGGSAGSSNGGYLGTGGNLGSGGSGGISGSAGGGGGGGGYFGGGGGGADVDSCCSDGGGGGGGSSWAYDLARNVSNTQGVNQGNGFAVIRYQLDYMITSHSISQINSDSYELKMNFNLGLDLAISDFKVGEGCLSELSTSDQLSWTLTVSNCAQNPATVELIDGSGSLQQKLPDLPLSFTLAMDISGPEVLQQDYPLRTRSSSASLKFSLTEAPVAISAESFIFTGCEELSLIANPIGFEVQLETCQEGKASLTVPAGSLRDRYGNFGPFQDAFWEWTIDQTGPIVEFISTDPSVDAPFNFTLKIFVDGYETNAFDGLVLDAGETQCQVSKQNSVLVFSECLEGSLSYTVPAFSFSDDLGNLGPETDQIFAVSLAAPAVVNFDPPTRESLEPAPQFPAQDQGPEPVASDGPITQPAEIELEVITEPGLEVVSEEQPLSDESDSLAHSDEATAEEIATTLDDGAVDHFSIDGPAEKLQIEKPTTPKSFDGSEAEPLIEDPTVLVKPVAAIGLVDADSGNKPWLSTFLLVCLATSVLIALGFGVWRLNGK